MEEEDILDCSFLESIKDDGTFREFTSDSFEPQLYANSVIEARKIGEALAKLSFGIDLLNKELHEQVATHHEDLLSQATGIETLEGVLQAIQTRISSLLASIERVRGHVVEPYKRIASRTSQLRRMQTTCDYLRRIIRILSLSKRLQTQLKAGLREITKSAQSLHELDYVVEGVDLSGIQIVQDDLELMKKARVEVEEQASKTLEQGLNMQNQSHIGTALQVFHNLNSLERRVRETIDSSIDALQKAVRDALDPKLLSAAQGVIQTSPSAGGGGPGRAAMPVAGNTAAWRAALWIKMDQMMDHLRLLCEKVFLLEKVLSKKRDPVTHVCFIDQFCEDGRSKIFHNFWDSMTSTLRAELDRSTEVSTHLRQAFEGEYPKLLKLCNQLHAQLSEFISSQTQASAGGVATTTSLYIGDILTGFLPTAMSPLDSLKVSLSPFANVYLSRSLSRLVDSVNLVLPDGAFTMPSKEEIASIMKTITSELNVASVDDSLMVLVSKNVSSTIKTYVAKCEQVLVTSPEAGQLSGGLTNAQIRNAAIINSLFDIHTGVAQILPDLTYPPQQAVDAISSSLRSVSHLMEDGVGLLLSSVAASLENKVARMHAEKFSIERESSYDQGSCSNYIGDIQDFISRINADYFSMYNCKDFLLERLQSVASRLLNLFVRHACLLRDISEVGRLKLAADMAQLEFAVAPLCRRIEDLGESYKLLRAFRPLIFQASEDIPTNPHLGESISFSCVLHFLFSKAPPLLQSPHTVAGWTVAEYSDWLDAHTDEHERIALIRGTLQAYTQNVKGRDDEECASVYRIMQSLLDKSDQA